MAHTTSEGTVAMRGRSGDARGRDGGRSMLNPIRHVLPASLLMLTGVFQLFEGIAGLGRQNFFRALPANYPYHLGTRPSGWVNIIVGGIAILTALALFTGNVAIRAWAI